MAAGSSLFCPFQAVVPFFCTWERGWAGWCRAWARLAAAAAAAAGWWCLRLNPTQHWEGQVLQAVAAPNCFTPGPTCLQVAAAVRSSGEKVGDTGTVMKSQKDVTLAKDLDLRDRWALVFKLARVEMGRGSFFLTPAGVAAQGAWWGWHAGETCHDRRGRSTRQSAHPPLPSLRHAGWTSTGTSCSTA